MRTCSTISSSVLGRPDQHSSAAAIAKDLASPAVESSLHRRIGSRDSRFESRDC
jgi:hypothetical protein